MKNIRTPRKLLGAWIPQARRNGMSGRPQQTIRHAYVHTLNKMGFHNCDVSHWMEIAKSRIDWANLVDSSFSFPPGTYSRTNAKNANAALKSYNDL